MNGSELSVMNTFFDIKILANESQETIEGIFEDDVKESNFYDPSYFS